MAGKWEASGVTKHFKDCHVRFNWLHPKIETKVIQLTRIYGSYINMVRNANAMKQILVKVRFNYVTYIYICQETQRNQLVNYCSSPMVGSPM